MYTRSKKYSASISFILIFIFLYAQHCGLKSAHERLLGDGTQLQTNLNNTRLYISQHATLNVAVSSIQHGIKLKTLYFCMTMPQLRENICIHVAGRQQAVTFFNELFLRLLQFLENFRVRLVLSTALRANVIK